MQSREFPQVNLSSKKAKSNKQVLSDWALTIFRKQVPSDWALTSRKQVPSDWALATSRNQMEKLRQLAWHSLSPWLNFPRLNFQPPFPTTDTFISWDK